LQRLTGQTLLLHLSAEGLLAVVLALLVGTPVWMGGSACFADEGVLFPAEFGIYIGALVVIMALIRVAVMKFQYRKGDSYIFATDIFGSPINDILLESFADSVAIVITLRGGRVYVGFVQQLPGFDPALASVTILRAYSGYRHAATKRVYFDAPYLVHWRRLFGNNVPLGVKSPEPGDAAGGASSAGESDQAVGNDRNQEAEPKPSKREQVSQFLTTFRISDIETIQRFDPLFHRSYKGDHADDGLADSAAGADAEGLVEDQTQTSVGGRKRALGA